jgi:glutaredoxin
VSEITITLIGKPACHLCEDAEQVVSDVLAQLEMPSVRVESLSIEDDEDLHDEYWEQIPVLLINGKVHNYWRIDADRLTKALKELA